MTAAAATLERSAGLTVPDCSAVTAGDGGPGTISMPGLPSGRLNGLKKERSALRTRLSRLEEARDELEAPGRLLEELEAERQAVELETAGAVSDWVSRGCEDARPVSDARRLF
jgi:hypothetical protein